MDFHHAVQKLGLTLPSPPGAKGLYRPVVRQDNWLFLSGQLPLQADGSLLNPGVVGVAVSLEEGRESAKLACLNALAWLNHEQERAGANWAFNLVKLSGFVAATPDFTQHPQVLNGASELLKEIFSDMNLPARTAVGVASLPLGACVELDLVVAILD